MNILVAEDQETSRYIISSHLRNWGHTVVDVDNGKAALAHIVSSPKNSIDMLITDWDMPFMNGVELARQVRKLTRRSGYVYIILLTVKNAHADFVKGFTEGEVDDYLIKPFSAARLRLHVQVGGRVVQSERELREHAANLEDTVQRQIREIRETQEEITLRLFNALESRHKETAVHVRRIGIMSAYLGRLVGWDSEKMEMLKLAAPLHDIGKIGLSDELLLNTGELSDNEREQMQEHTSIGARILSGSTNATVQMAERIALSHHENWDGSGYPNGLGGNQRPLEAQLVSIIDVYDAQLAEKDYRPGVPEDEALSYISQQAGCKFAPALVRLFLKHLDAIKEQWWIAMVK